MEINVEKLSPVLVEFQVQVPAETVTREVNEAYQQLGRTARVRGFRRGKAPRRVLTQLYGRAVNADVAKRLVDTSLQTALTEKEMQPLTQPAVEPSELKAKTPFSFKARFEVRPTIEALTWKGLAAERGSAEVTDAQLDEEIERLRLQHSTMEPVEGRAAENGDFLTLMISFNADGEEQSEEVDAEVGGGKILPAIEEALPGMKPGDAKEVAANFPDAHPNPAMAGQDVKFTLTAKELKKRVLPEIDDEFAKDCEFDDLTAMKAGLRVQLGERLAETAEEELAKQLVAELCEKNPIAVPPSLVEQQARQSEQELRMLAQMSGQPVQPGDEFRERVRADAETKVRAGLLMAEIAKECEIKVDEEDIEKGYQELADQSGKNVARIKAEYRERSKREMLVGMILEDKVLDLLVKEANISGA